MDDSRIRRRVEIDREVWHALQPLMRERGWSLHQAADEAFRALLRPVMCSRQAWRSAPGAFSELKNDTTSQ
jgi:hypothetical protein